MGYLSDIIEKYVPETPGYADRVWFDEASAFSLDTPYEKSKLARLDPRFAPGGEFCPADLTPPQFIRDDPNIVIAPKATWKAYVEKSQRAPHFPPIFGVDLAADPDETAIFTASGVQLDALAQIRGNSQWKGKSREEIYKDIEGLLSNHYCRPPTDEEFREALLGEFKPTEQENRAAKEFFAGKMTPIRFDDADMRVAVEKLRAHISAAFQVPEHMLFGPSDRRFMIEPEPNANPVGLRDVERVEKQERREHKTEKYAKKTARKEQKATANLLLAACDRVEAQMKPNGVYW